MNKKIENLRDLFIEQGRELYDASKQEQKELPNIQKKVSNQQLIQVIDRQLNAAKNQNSQLQQAFKKLNVSPEGEKNQCFQSIFKQTKSLIDRCKDPAVCDAAIVNSIQQLNHNKITGFGSLSSYAKEIGQEEISSSLHETLDEEKAIDNELSELAENEINKKAVSAIAL